MNWVLATAVAENRPDYELWILMKPDTGHSIASCSNLHDGELWRGNILDHGSESGSSAHLFDSLEDAKAWCEVVCRLEGHT